MFSIALPLVLVGIYIFSRKKQALGNISYEFGLPTRLRLNRIDFNSLLPITFDNASPQQASFENLYLKLVYKGSVIGNVTYPYKVTIQRASRTKIDTNIRVSVAAIALQLGAAIIGQNFVLSDIQVQGFVKGAGINTFIDKTIKLSFSPTTTA